MKTMTIRKMFIVREYHWFCFQIHDSQNHLKLVARSLLIRDTEYAWNCKVDPDPFTLFQDVPLLYTCLIAIGGCIRVERLLQGESDFGYRIHVS